MADDEPRRWGKAGVRLTDREAESRDRRNAGLRAARQRHEAADEITGRKEWAEGRVRPHMITVALNRRRLYGPEVDEACGVEEPAVDQWEAGELYPTWPQLRALAVLCQVPVGRFMWRGTPALTVEQTSMRFHIKAHDEVPPPPVLCFTPQAILAATGTARCPYCQQSAGPVMPVFLFCPHCGTAQRGRTVVGGVFAQCPDCGGRWPTVPVVEH
jgi:hypothetical protein